ncbi:exocyst subunit exo70 family protein D1 [Forsythia ovata]|uniref:Exocyst subunit exo70 family protein D1 n=1 Tax=Forsythia ovata TaxID=205694 RepID=A0ABD1WV90_9LAMI
MIFEGDRHEIDRYLHAVDEIQKSIESTTVSESSSSTLQIAMARLEDEFRNILLFHTSPVEKGSLIDPTNSSIHSASTSRTNSIEFNSKSNEEEFKEDSSGNIVIEGNVVKILEHQESNSSSAGSMYKSTSSIREIDLIPNDAIYDLRCIAERMIAAGYLRECIQVYWSVRKSAVDASFKRLGIEKLSIGDIQRLE